MRKEEEEVEWLYMEGKGFYVWLSYGVGFVVLGVVAYEGVRRRGEMRKRFHGSKGRKEG